MSSNEAVAACFEEMAKLLDLLGADSFRVTAHARAARVIADYPGDIASLAADRTALTKLEGIGTKTADKIIECINTGTVGEMTELRAQVPPGLLELLNIPGLGPKTVRMFWKDAASSIRPASNASSTMAPSSAFPAWAPRASKNSKPPLPSTPNLRNA
jgi:DNA polymerase (family 10)